jgi:hypothetical protein
MLRFSSIERRGANSVAKMRIASFDKIMGSTASTQMDFSNCRLYTMTLSCLHDGGEPKQRTKGLSFTQTATTTQAVSSLPSVAARANDDRYAFLRDCR